MKKKRILKNKRMGINFHFSPEGIRKRKEKKKGRQTKKGEGEGTERGLKNERMIKFHLPP